MAVNVDQTGESVLMWYAYEGKSNLSVVMVGQTRIWDNRKLIATERYNYRAKYIIIAHIRKYWHAAEQKKWGVL